MTKYRIVSGITGFGWVTVEKWNEALGRYAPLTSFRTIEEAREFIKWSLSNDQPNLHL